MERECYDTIIIGGGPGAVAAAVYAARKKMKTLIVTESFGGQSIASGCIENWVGDVKIKGLDLADRLEKHVYAQEGIEIRMPERVTGLIEGKDRIFEVKTEKNGPYRSRTVIIASGARSRRLQVPGEDQFDGRGVSYCSTCDAPLFNEAEVAVVGSGNSALETVIDLQPYARKIYLLIRREQPKGDPVTLERATRSEKVKVINHVDVQEIYGDQSVTGLRYKEKLTGEVKNLPIQGIFVEIGSVPNVGFVNGLVKKNPSGEIIVDHRTAKTSRDGIFAVGDVTDDLYKQNNIAAGDGVRGALSAYHYVSNLKTFSPCEEKEENFLETQSKEKKAFVEKIEARLKEWTEKMDEFKALVDKSKGELERKYRKQAEELRNGQEALQKKLMELRESGEETWGKMRTQTEKSLRDLERSFDRTLSKFRESEKEIAHQWSGKKKAYLKKAESQLRDWKTQINVLKARAEKSKAEAREKYFEQIKELQKKEAAVKQRVQELKETGDEAWEELKKGMDHAFDELSKAMKQAVSLFKRK